MTEISRAVQRERCEDNECMKCQATVTLGRETFDRVMQRVESLQCLFCGYMIAKKNKERKGTTQRKTFVCQRKACTDTVLVY